MHLVNKKQFAKWLRDVAILRWGMKIVARLLAPRQCVGAVGAVLNSAGQVLLVEHLFRTDFPWGLPGGWIERGEDPMETVRREIEEELQIQVEVRDLLCSEQVGLTAKSTHPRHLGLGYYCRYVSGECALTAEIISVEWVDALHIRQELAPFQRKTILLARRVFDQEQTDSLNQL